MTTSLQLEITDQAADYAYTSDKHLLVSELRAVRGHCDEIKAQTIFSYVKPERITIGEYRPSKGLASHIGSRFPESSLLKINSGLISDGTKLRYPEEHRLAMFKVIIDTITKHDRKVKVALCKEDIKIWKNLSIPINGLHCNCLG